MGEVKERKGKCPGGDSCVLNFCSLRILIFLDKAGSLMEIMKPGALSIIW